MLCKAFHAYWGLNFYHERISKQEKNFLEEDEDGSLNERIH